MCFCACNGSLWKSLKKWMAGRGGFVYMESSCDGFVAFTAKSNLVEYYKRSLNAKIAAGRRMYLDSEAATALINKYMRK